MEEVRTETENLVKIGIRVYIELLAYGERVRSARVFRDVITVSALVAGGPSRRVPGKRRTGIPPAGTIVATIRSLLATLLVLRSSRYWDLIPDLASLVESCTAVAASCGDGREETYGRTSSGMNCAKDRCAGEDCGCRRSNALPVLPTLSE